MGCRSGCAYDGVGDCGYGGASGYNGVGDCFNDGGGGCFFFLFISYVYSGLVQCCNDNRQQNNNTNSKTSYIVCTNATH